MGAFPTIQGDADGAVLEEYKESVPGRADWLGLISIKESVPIVWLHLLVQMFQQHYISIFLIGWYAREERRLLHTAIRKY